MNNSITNQIKQLLTVKSDIVQTINMRLPMNDFIDIAKEPELESYIPRLDDIYGKVQLPDGTKFCGSNIRYMPRLYTSKSISLRDLFKNCTTLRGFARPPQYNDNYYDLDFESAIDLTGMLAGCSSFGSEYFPRFRNLGNQRACQRLDISDTKINLAAFFDWCLNYGNLKDRAAAKYDVFTIIYNPGLDNNGDITRTSIKIMDSKGYVVQPTK